MIDTSFTERQVQYLQLLARGFTDSQIAMHMCVRRWTIQNEYREAILSKTFLSTKEEIVEWARKHGYGDESEKDEEVGSRAETKIRALKGLAMAPAREFYRSLELHFLASECEGCTSYHNYGVMVIHQNFEYHMQALAGQEQHVDTLLYHLQKSELLEVHRDLYGVYRISFVRLLPEGARHV